MSRGIGTKQSFIIKTLESNEANSLTTGSLLWRYYTENNEKIEEIPKHEYTSFNRSINSLQERGQITVEKRKLSSLKECESHYPYKTRSFRKMILRRNLMPIFVEDAISGKLIPRYHLGKNEDLHMSNHSDEEHAIYRQRWHQIDSELRQLLAQSNDPNSTLLELLCEGRNRFMKAKFLSSRSLGLSLAKFKQEYRNEFHDITDLIKFYDDFFPKLDRKKLKFKSYIHELADCNSSGPYKLRHNTIKLLLDLNLPFIKDFFNPEAIVTSRAHPFSHIFDSPLFKDKELLGFFDQSVFKTYDFLTIA